MKHEKGKGLIHSIRGKYTILMASLMAAMIVLICLANTLYLEKFYVSEKTRSMKATFARIDEMLESENLADAATQQNALRVLENVNISALIADKNNNSIWKFGYGNRIEEQMRDMIYGNGIKKARVLEQNDQYVICRWEDTKQETGYLLLWGFMDNGGFCFMRASLPGLKDSAGVSARFAWIIGMIAIGFSTVVVSFVSKRISEPIIRLSKAADRMAHLDFSVHCETDRDDEIAVLGQSMNAMSGVLEKTIYGLREANAHLLQDIREKEHKEQLRKEFISNISHELKTPIALIQGYAEGLQEGIGEDPESMDYYCEVIVDEAARMNQLVRKLLTLSELEEGAGTVEMADYDLNGQIRQILHTFDLVVRQKDIMVENEISDPLIVRADEFLMEEVIRNYISNAMNHMEDDRDGRKRLRIYLEEDAFHVRVNIWNTGTPIPEESLAKVWDKFYKVDQSHSRQYGGSGIGLSIVKAAMEAQGGSCGVFDTDNGVCFWFELSRLALPAVKK